jgi:Flp pilus assembly pilin Flp
MKHDRHGLGAVEWAVIAGLIGLTLVVGVAQLGTKVSQHLENTSSEYLVDGSSSSSDSFWGGLNDYDNSDDSDNTDDAGEADNQNDSDDDKNSSGSSRGRGRRGR